MVMSERNDGQGNNVSIYVNGASDNDNVNVRFGPLDESTDDFSMISNENNISTEMATSSILMTPPSSPASGDDISLSLPPSRRRVLRRRATFGRRTLRTEGHQDQSTYLISPDVEVQRAGNDVSWNYQSPSGSLEPERRRAHRRRAIIGHRRPLIGTSRIDNESENSFDLRGQEPTNWTSQMLSPGSIDLSSNSDEDRRGWNNLDASRPRPMPFAVGQSQNRHGRHGHHPHGYNLRPRPVAMPDRWSY